MVPVQLVFIMCADGSHQLMKLPLTDRRRGVDLVAGAAAEAKPLREYIVPVVERELEKCREAWALVAPQRLPIASWRFIEDGDLSDWDYRVSWKDTGSKIECDLPKAREVHRNRVRERRAKLFEQLDNDRKDAEDNDDKPALRQLALKRKRLKDATVDPRIEAATTIEELRGVDPLAGE